MRAEGTYKGVYFCITDAPEKGAGVHRLYMTVNGYWGEQFYGQEAKLTQIQALQERMLESIMDKIRSTPKSRRHD